MQRLINNATLRRGLHHFRLHERVRLSSRYTNKHNSELASTLILQPIAGQEEPGNERHAEGQEANGDRQAQSDMYVGDIEKAPRMPEIK